MKSGVAVPLALWGHGRVSSPVVAVIVDGVLATHPFEAVVLTRVEVSELPLVPPALALGGAELGLHGRLAAVDVELPVRRHERCLRPVRLLESAARGPIVRVPQARVQLHRLVEREFHPDVLAVLEHPDRSVVHEESATFSVSFLANQSYII